MSKSGMAVSSRLYVAMGDSTGVGVGAQDGRGYVARLFERILAKEPRFTLSNLCVSGATAPMVAAYQLPRALAAKPNLLSLFVGMNDTVWGSEPSFRGALERISASLREQRIVGVLCALPNLAHAPLASAPQVRSQRAALERKIANFNSHIRSLCARDGHVLVDLFAVGLADSHHYFSSDGYHPSSDGYEALAQMLWEHVEPLLSG